MKKSIVLAALGLACGIGSGAIAVYLFWPLPDEIQLIVTLPTEITPDGQPADQRYQCETATNNCRPID
jgi:hypothetical protein